MLLPAKLAAVPAGLIRDKFSVMPMDDGDVTITIGFKQSTTPSTADDDYTIIMTVVSADLAAQEVGNPAPDTSPVTPGFLNPIPVASTTAGGRPYVISTNDEQSGPSIHVGADGTRLMLDISWTNKISPVADLRWAAFMPAASMDDTSTWFDASVAIP